MSIKRRLLIVALLSVLLTASCYKPKTQTIRVATYGAFDDIGLTQCLRELCEKELGFNLVFDVFPGDAVCDEAENGKYDLVISNDSDQNDIFIRDGYGLYRKDLMSNYYVIAGNAEDSASVGIAEKLTDALQAANTAGAKILVSNSDRTLANRLSEIFKRLNLDQNAYLEWTDRSPAETLEAIEKSEKYRRSYTIIDPANFADELYGDGNGDIRIVYKSDPELKIICSVMPVNPDKSGRPYAGTDKFCKWLFSESARKQIRAFIQNKTDYSDFYVT